MTKESQLPFAVGYIFLAASGVGAVEKDHRLLELAAEALNGMLEVGAGKMAIMAAGKIGFDVEFESGSEDSSDEGDENYAHENDVIL
jgi:hypothetical protein